MRFILFFLLLYSPLVFPQRTLNQQTFTIKVKPVLNGILSNFYQMITLFPDYPKDLILLIEEVDTLTVDKEAMKSSCPKTIDSNCKTAIKSLITKLQRAKALSLKLMASQKMSSSLHLNTMSGLKFVNEFDLKLEEAKSLVDNASFLLAAKIPNKRPTFPIIKKLDELNTYLSLAVVEYIPYTYREDFRHFYFNFVHPIQIQISKHNNYEFLNKNVNSLNFAINFLNMSLTKRSKKTPDGMAPYLATIHNRWNSLLRYYF